MNQHAQKYNRGDVDFQIKNNRNTNRRIDVGKGDIQITGIQAQTSIAQQ
jgi:hypothetical protein